MDFLLDLPCHSAMLIAPAIVDQYLILIPFGLLNQKTNFSYLKEVNAFDIFVLTPDTVYILKENKEKEVIDTINKSLIIRASGINHLGTNS